MNKQYTYIENQYPARPRSKRRREMGGGTSSGGGTTVVSGGGITDGGTGSVTSHSQLSGIISTVDEYSEFAKDIHLAAADADTLKRLSTLEIIESTDEETIPTDFNLYSALKAKLEDERHALDMENKYIRKDKPDYTKFLLELLDGALFGKYIEGLLGSGGKFDKDGNIEAKSLILREFLQVPELRFNRIDVVSGELWNAIAFGLIESVDETNQVVTLKLEDGELSGMHLNDFCRGIFHNLTGNTTEEGKDSAGFDTIPGFSTSYFTPVEIIDNASFRYELKPGTTVHPCKAMKFAVYGNPTDENRQASVYHTRRYIRFLRDVKTWDIRPEYITVQLGDLSDLVVNGEPLDKASVYLNNIYFGGNIWFTPGALESLKGNDAYSVTLSTYNAVYNIADGIYEQADIVSGDKNIMTGDKQVVASQFNVSSRIQASKGPEQLRFSTTIGSGKYVVTSKGTNCTYVITDGLVAVQDVTADEAEIKIEVNCEGIAVYEVVFTIVRVADGRDGKDYEYIYKLTATEAKPATPDTSQADDFVPAGWTDDSVGPTLTQQFEWVCKRVKRDKVWGNYQEPSLWARFGEDGKDYEYIYTRTSTNSQPATPVTSQADDYIPSGWTDDPVGPTRALPFEWVSKRSKVNALWGSFSTPAIFSNFAEDGKSNETIYRRTTTYSTPATPGTSQTDDYIPSGWTDDPIGVNPTYVYEWMSERSKVKGVWGSFSTPALWAKYSFDGQDGGSGSDGIDGRSDYMVFRRSVSQPSTPYGSTVPPSGWSLDPPAGTSPLWASKATFNANGTLYRNWSTPVKMSGDPGVPGGTGPAITYRGEYSSLKQYTGTPERVDVVKEGSYWYIAKTTAGVFSGQYPGVETDYWKRTQGSFESIATGLLITEEASIASFWFSNNRIESQNRNLIIDGNANDDPRIALGATFANRHNAPLRMYEDGRLYAKKGEIGPFQIAAANGEQLISGDLNGNYLRLSGNTVQSKWKRSNTDQYGYFDFTSYVEGVFGVVSPIARLTARYGTSDKLYGQMIRVEGSDSENIYLRMDSYDTAVMELKSKHFSNDASWLYRTCIVANRLPSVTQIQTLYSSGGPTGNIVKYDQKTGQIYFE